MPNDRPCRALTADEIAALEAAGSRADDWSNVQVADGFLPQSVARCTFAGPIRLGVFDKPVAYAGASLASGVYDSRLHNVTVAEGALVDRVGLLSNYDVGPGAIVRGCASVAVEGETAFGNGTEIEVFNEGGGRELRIYDRLTAQIAYLAVCYRHRPKLIDALERMIDAYVADRRSDRGSIGAGATLADAGTIRNVTVGPAAVVEGAARLDNGTVASKPEAPTTIGAGVQATDFVIGTGSKVDGGAMLSGCFVGQGCKIGRQFSAEGSAFFANCEGFHGEACSVLAGPYTVTHHKSSLLIAGLFSFYNAGSGTNQSNHMYKLGPVHQGILERGSKTGSFSYLLWPCRVGAFTAVIGKHYANFDTRNLPFSYIDEIEGRSVLTPAMNLFTVGTKRDGDKWPARDRRTDPEKLDRIRFEVLSPLTIGRLMKGMAEVAELYATASREQEYVSYNGISIKRLLCRTAKRHYEIAVKVYFGGLLADRLESGSAEALAAEPGPGAGEWVDVLGLLAPANEVEALCAAIESGGVSDLTALEAEFGSLYDAYDAFEWAWAQDAWQAWAGKAPSGMNADELAEAIAAWQDASIKLNNMILADAKKEFAGPTRIGFGIDGDEAVRDGDFTAVRGTFDDNKFVAQLQQHSDEVRRRAEAILAQLRKAQS